MAIIRSIITLAKHNIFCFHLYHSLDLKGDGICWTFIEVGKFVGLYAGDMGLRCSFIVRESYETIGQRGKCGKGKAIKVNGGWMLDGWRARRDIMFFMKP